MTTANDSAGNAVHDGRRRWRMPGLAAQIFIGLGLGIVAGILFGETMAAAKPIGAAFIGVLQMTVLPYLLVSLVGGLGRLSYEDARMLGLRGGMFIILFWAVGLLAVVALALTLPSWESAAFFSSTLVETGGKTDFVSLYIPSNPFFSLANGIVPAVVLFSVALGLALIPMQDKKQPILVLLDTFTDALMRMATFVVRLAPIGVFALVAAAAGTMRLEEFGRLQIYIYSYIAIALLLSFWVLPGLVAALLPISYRRVMTCAQDALVTAFATGALLVVLPLLAERIKKVLTEIQAGGRDSEAAVNVVVPVNFSLPNLGKLMALAFIPFAGWFSGFELSVGQYPVFLISGVISLFGEVVVALPFLLDLVRIPADLFHLFIAVDVFTGRVGTLLAGVHTVALALLIGGAVSGRVTLNMAKLGRFLLITGALSMAVIVGLRLFYEYVLPHEYRQYQSFIKMQPLAKSVPSTVHEHPPAGDVRPGESRLARIRARGTLRVGYLKDRLPSVFTNADGKLVGFDVDMANVLARDLGLKLEFAPVRFDPNEMARQLEQGQVDIVMTGLAVTPERASAVRFTRPYGQATLAFIVRDHDRKRFSSRSALQRLKRPRIGVLNVPYYVDKLKHYLPQAQIVLLESPRDFFGKRGKELDAMLGTAEAGSAWTLIHPEFSVAIPKPDVLAAPIAYAVAADAEELMALVDTWLELKRQDKTIEKLYQHWILGGGARPREPRWSIVRDVLHWVD